MFEKVMVADLCEAIAEFIATSPEGAEVVARKLGKVLRQQHERQQQYEREARERERTTGTRY